MGDGTHYKHTPGIASPHPPWGSNRGPAPAARRGADAARQARLAPRIMRAIHPAQRAMATDPCTFPASSAAKHGL